MLLACGPPVPANKGNPIVNKAPFCRPGQQSEDPELKVNMTVSEATCLEKHVWYPKHCKWVKLDVEHKQIPCNGQTRAGRKNYRYQGIGPVVMLVGWIASS
jgi:hypothetical protein